MSQPVANMVSIVSANFNNAAYLPGFFNSIIQSDTWPREVIIVDDGSTDESVRIIRDFASKFSWIKPVLLDQNVGVAHATNRGLDAATGQYILRIDPDDMLMPMRISRQSGYLDNHPDVDVLGGNCWYIDAHSQKKIFRSNFPDDYKTIATLFKSGENGVLNGTTMVRKQWFDRFKYRQEMVWAEDYDVFARMLSAGAVMAGDNDPHTLVRIHRASATSNLQWDTIEKAYLLSRELFDNKRSLRSVQRNFLHLHHYRKYLLNSNAIIRVYHLIMAGIYRPDKVLKRLHRK